MAPPGRTRIGAALLAVWLLWGSTFLGIRVVVAAAPPLLSAGVRFALAGAILAAGVAAWWRSRGEPGPVARLRGRFARLALLGLLHFLVANGLVSVASRWLPSSSVGVYFATVPLWVLGVGVVTGRRPTRGELAAAALGIAGVGTLLGFQAGTPLPALLVLLAAVVWAVAGRIAAAAPARATGPEPGVALGSAVQMLVGGVALLAASPVAGEWTRLRLDALRPIVFLAEAHLVLLGSIVGFLAYTWLVTRVDQRLASTYSYVNPVVAVALGVLLLHERFGASTLVGTGLVTAAVAWTVLAAVRRTGRPAPSLRPNDIPIGSTT